MSGKMNFPNELNNPRSTEQTIDRRNMLRTTGTAVLAASAFPLQWVAAGEKKKQKILYFSRSVGFEHDAVKIKNGKPSISDRILTELGKRHGFEVVCTKDGRVFDGDLNQYDAIVFYTSGVLTEPNKAKTPPMSVKGKKGCCVPSPEVKASSAYTPPQIPSILRAPVTRTRLKLILISLCSAVSSSCTAPSRKP